MTTIGDLGAELKEERGEHEKTKAKLRTALGALRFSQEIQESCERTMGDLRQRVMKLAEGQPLHECDGRRDGDALTEELQADKTELHRHVAELQQANAQLVNEAAECARIAGDLEQQLASERKENASNRESLARINAAHTDGVNRWRRECPGRAMQMPLTRAELVGWLLTKVTTSADPTADEMLARVRDAIEPLLDTNPGDRVATDQVANRVAIIWSQQQRHIAEMGMALDGVCDVLRPLSGVAGHGIDALIASAKSVADLEAKWKKTESKLQSIRDRQRSIIDHRGSVEIVDIDGKTCGHGHWDEVDGRFVLRVAQRYVEHPPDGKRATDQPTPKHDPSKPDVWGAIMYYATGRGMSEKFIDAMGARRKLGIGRYGTPLQPWNERDAERDLREELLDATAYAGQRAMECRGLLIDPIIALAEDARFKEILAITHAAVTAP